MYTLGNEGYSLRTKRCAVNFCTDVVDKKAYKGLRIPNVVGINVE